MTHNDGTEANAHLHADVTENGYFMQGRSECFTGADALDHAQNWLAKELAKDAENYPAPKEGDWHAVDSEIRRWTGSGEAYEGNVTVPGNRPGYGVIMGYRLMWIDGDCDRII